MVHVRRSELADAGAIGQIVGANTELVEERFGAPFRLSTHVEHSCLAISALDEADGRTVGFASFFDYPKVAEATVKPYLWEEWVGERFPDLKGIHPNTTTWLSLFVAESDVESDAAHTLVRTMFTTLSQLDSCLLCLPTSVPIFAPLSKFFKRLEPVYDVPFAIYLCDRATLVPSLKIRLAQVEDHDDLIPVLNKQSDLHTDVHGEFFLAEVIEGQDETHKCIVAEADGRAVGLIAVTTDIDLELLNECHDLTAWGGLGREVEVEVDSELYNEGHEEAGAEFLEQPTEDDAAAADSEAELEPTEGDGDLAAADGEGGEEAGAGEGADGEAEVGDSETLDVESEPAPAAVEYQAEYAPSTTKTIIEPNCFAITMFCLDKKYECRASDFLAPLFQVFGQDRGLQYCILTLPHTECESALMPYLSHVKPTSCSTFPHSLYLLHRDSLLPPPRAQVTSHRDVEAITQLLNGLVGESQESITSMVVNDINGLNAGVKPFTIVSDTKVIGVLAFDHSMSADNLKAEWKLEEMLYLAEHSEPEQVASLRYLLLHPVYECHAQFVLTDAMRLTSISLVASSATASSMPPSVIDHFVQPLPRRLVQRGADLDINYADVPNLHVFAKRFLYEPKTIINARVVVVGASDTGLGFLESLLSVPYLHFNNLTLLTKDGMPRHCDKPFTPYSHTFAPGEIEKFGIALKVNILEQTMIGLDRQAKVVKLASGSVLPYDFLVIAVGLQDQAGRQLVESQPEVESQVFSVSSTSSVENLVSVLGENVGMSKTVVYGSGLDVYCAVEGLILHGVPPSEIQLVQATELTNPAADEDFFAHHGCDYQMKAILEELKISCRSGQLESCVSDNNGCLRAVVLRDEAGSTSEIPCGMLVTCATPDIDIDAFNAVNDQSLIYDGALVVDGRFRTNDPTIFAAGPVVKHQRRLRARIPIRCYNSREVGNRLAACVLPVVDPASAFDLDEPIALTPYHRPKVIGGRIPGGSNVFVVQKPQEMSNSNPNVGLRELVTEGSQQYCRITLDRYAHISGLFHFGSAEVEHQNWLTLYGLPETVINRLSSRYDEGIILDFVDFLREEWAMALYHDRFSDLMTLLAERLEDDNSILKLQETAQSKLDEGEFKVDLAMRRLVEATGHMEMWGKCEWLLKQYISDNRNHLPMYNVQYAPI